VAWTTYHEQRGWRPSGALLLLARIHQKEPDIKHPPQLQPLPASAYSLFVGVDIAARTAVAAWIVPGEPVTRPITIEQSSTGFTCLNVRYRPLLD